MKQNILTLVALLLALPLTPEAHPLAPSSLQLLEMEKGNFEVAWRTPTVRPIGEELVPRLPSRCRATSSPTTEIAENQSSVEHRWAVECGEEGIVGAVIRVDGLTTASTTVVVEVRHQDGARSSRGLLHRGESTFLVPARQAYWRVVVDYLRLGTEHLLTGPDHILFVLGLLLLLRRRRSLALAVTAFTVGHSVSLCFATLGFLRVPSAPIEVAIALTLMILALDVLRAAQEESPGPVARWPWVVCTLFGLLHGMGFAGALAHAGLPERAIPLSLLSFNVGIEVGQLLIIALVLGGSALLKRVSSRVHVPRVGAAYVIGSLAGYWMLERTFGAFGILSL